MNPLIHKARSLRLQSQAAAAEADYNAARGDAEAASFFRSIAADYADLADATEIQAEEFA